MEDAHRYEGEETAGPIPDGMMLTSKQHKKLAKAYAKPPPNLSPEEAQVWQTLARAHALLTRWARKRETGRPPAPTVEAGAEGKPQLVIPGAAYGVRRGGSV
jgi:hypothetical protein